MYKMNKKNSYKQRSATIMVLVGLMFIFFIPVISAFDFDNKLTYSNEDMNVAFDNFYGLGTHYGEIELKSHSSVTEILKTGFGKEEVVMYYDFTNWELYKDGLGDVKFIDMRTEKEVEKDYTFVEWKETNIPKYINNCEYEENGTAKNCITIKNGTKKEFNWVDYNSKDIPAKDIRIGLKTYVGKSDYIDGVWEIVGKKVSKHITWSGDLNTDLVSYYSLEDETDEKGLNDLTNYGSNVVDGIINNAFNSTAMGEVLNVTSPTNIPDGTDTWAWSFWINNQGNSGSDGGGYVCNGNTTGYWTCFVEQEGATKTLRFVTAAGADYYPALGPDLGNNGWHHIVGMYDGTQLIAYVDLVNIWNHTISLPEYSGASHIFQIGGAGWNQIQFFSGTVDEVGVWSRLLSYEEILFLNNENASVEYGDDLIDYPSVTLETPNNFTNFTATNEVDFECLPVDYVNDIVNVSLYIDGVLNETNTDGLNESSAHFTNIILSEGTHDWTCEVYSNISASFTAEKFLLDVNTTPNIAFGIGVYPDYSNITNDFFNVNVTLTETFFKNVTFDLYLANGVLNQTETFTDATRSRNWTDLPDATYSYNVTTATTTNQFNNTATRNITIDATSPAVNVFYPTENIEYQELNTNLSLNWSANDTNLDTCIYNYNTTNMTATCSDNQTNMNITDYTYTNVSFWVNDTFGHVTYTFIEWNYRLFLVSESFTTPVTEGSSNAFTINLRTNGSDITLGNLSYNNLQNFGTITETSTDNFTITKSIIAPPVTEETNYSFFWEISQNGLSYDFTPQNQTVNDIGIDNCSVNKIVLYNFTIVGEESQSKLSGTDANTTGKINLQLYNLLRTVTLTDYSSFFNETNPFYVCINASLLAEEKYVVDVQIEYDAGIYEKELYHIQNATINSTTINTNITLYDLLTANSQVFKLSARDTSFLALSDAIIEIHRKYVDEGTFKIVEIPKTDGKGETTAHLKTNDAIYNFIIKKFGVTISTFNNVLAVCQTPLVSPCVIDFNAISAGITIPDYEEDEDFSYTLGYDSATKIVTTEFIIPSGEATTVFLNVTRYDALGTAVCTDTLTSTAGTLSCVVPNSFGNATVIATLTKDGSYVASGTIKLNQDPSDIYGTSLIFLGLFVMLTLIGAAISDNPVYTIIFFMVGVILLFALNLVANNGFIGGTATILFLIVAIILVIIKGARRN